MSDQLVSGQALVPYTFATWVCRLHAAGIFANHEAIHGACVATFAATNEEDGNKAGEELVEQVKALLANHDLPSAASALFGDRAATDMGEGDRLARTHRIRKYQFSKQLPWLATIWERVEGEVSPSWLLVERVTDEVTAADPNPWNDIDEERHIPVADFHVLWELSNCSCVYVA